MKYTICSDLITLIKDIYSDQKIIPLYEPRLMGNEKTHLEDSIKSLNDFDLISGEKYSKFKNNNNEL